MAEASLCVALPDMLRRFGYLLALFVEDRKHRLVSKYGRDRHNDKSWDAGLMEDVTCHQLWELAQPFYFAAKESKPVGLMRSIGQDLLPDIALDAIKILSSFSVNGGKAAPGDVVAFVEDDSLSVGRLLLSVGVHSTTSSSLSFISKWRQLALEDEWLICEMSDDDDVVQVKTETLESVLLNSPPTANSRCTIVAPPELWPQ